MSLYSLSLICPILFKSSSISFFKDFSFIVSGISIIAVCKIKSPELSKQNTTLPGLRTVLTDLNLLRLSRQWIIEPRITSYNVCYTKLLRYNITTHPDIKVFSLLWEQGICKTVGNNIPVKESGSCRKSETNISGIIVCY